MQEPIRRRLEELEKLRLHLEKDDPCTDCNQKDYDRPVGSRRSKALVDRSHNRSSFALPFALVYQFRVLLSPTSQDSLELSDQETFQASYRRTRYYTRSTPEPNLREGSGSKVRGLTCGQ